MTPSRDNQSRPPPTPHQDVVRLAERLPVLAYALLREVGLSAEAAWDVVGEARR